MKILALALALVPAAATDKRAFDLPDVYGIAQVSSPAVSPDGRSVVFGVRRFDVAAASVWSELWTVGIDGKGARQLTSAKKMDGDPRFTHDGNDLVFVSNRSGTSQLWTMPVDGG